MRAGVNPSSCWLPEGQWPTMLHFLCAQFPDISQHLWLLRLRADEIIDSNNVVINETTPYRSGIHLYYYRELPSETTVPFKEEILFHNEHLIVVDKPHFLPVIPSGRFLQQTLLVRLKNTLGLRNLTPVHRLDKDTAGLVMFSCEPASRNAYHQLFEQRRIHKTYHAIAATRRDLCYPLRHQSRLESAAEFYRMQEVAGASNTETHIVLLEERGEHSLYRLNPVTGKKHQLRVHMAALGMPLVNDVLYPAIRHAAHDDFSHPLQLLAKQLHFTDPLTGEERSFTSKQSL